MKQFFVLLIAMAGFFSLDVNAQSCCTTQTECKPAQCCPAQPTCCDASESIIGNFFKKLKAEFISKEDIKSEPKPEDILVREKEVLATTNNKND